MTSRFILIVFIFPLICVSQTLKGRVIDKLTQAPIETAAVYFDNTTLGTTTNEKGEFAITYTDAVQSTLVISYLGYEKVLISDYRTKNNIRIELIEEDNALNEVYIEYDDGLTRRQKLKLFRREFLGVSKYGQSCKILNENELVLKYDKKNKALYASSRVPLKVFNKALKYEIAYDIIDFEVNFRYQEPTNRLFNVLSVTYFGTSFYKNLDGFNSKKVTKNRNAVYKGSVQHFMRSLYKKNLEAESYQIFHDKFRVDEWAHFTVEDMPDSDFKSVKLSTDISVLYDQKFQSRMELKIPEFYVDVYGNYLPVVGVYFGGKMGNQRVGDMLPSDYGLNTNK